MPVRLPSEDIEFLRRVSGYCAAGMAQPQMAKRECVSLTSFRLRLFRCGFAMEAKTTREVIRTGSGERLGDLLAGGQIEAEETAVPA